MMLALATLLCVALSAPIAFADDGRIGGEPGNVHVIGSDDIRMESETVQAVVYGRFAEYVVDFAFVNSGPEQLVRLGFPFGLDDKAAEELPVALAGFLAYQDGKPLEVTLGTGMDGPRQTGWFEHEAIFPPGSTRIRVRYVTRPSVTLGLPEEASESAPPAYRGMGGAIASYPYILHTGSGWAGTIGRAVVRYAVSAELEGWEFGAAGSESWGTTPAGFTRPDARTLVWIFEDFEPVQDADGWGSPYDIRAVYYQPSYAWYDYDSSRPADPDWAAPPLAEAQASSTSPVLEYESPKHDAARAIDGDPATAWISAEGAAFDPWLRIDRGEARRAHELLIVPGYARTPAEFAEHGRPKTIDVRFAGGGGAIFTLEDESTVQRVPLGMQDLPQATIVVTDVYPGTKYDDVAISEVEIASASSPNFLTFDEALALEGTPIDPDAEPDADDEPEPAEEPPADEGDGAPQAEDEPQGLLQTIITVVVLAVAVILGATSGVQRRARRDARAKTPQ
jgi:hypothetical protein